MIKGLVDAFLISPHLHIHFSYRSLNTWTSNFFYSTDFVRVTIDNIDEVLNKKLACWLLSH